jgi:phage terminase large subunit
MTAGRQLDLNKFKKHVQDRSPAFVGLFKDKSRYQIPWGGAGSGKSHIVARKLLYRMFNESEVKHNILIIRKVDRTIKKSVWTLVKNIISLWGQTDQFQFNQTDRTMIYKKTGSQFMFSGLDDVEKLKSIEGVTSIWIEEATELLQEDFEQLDLRLRGEHGCLKQIILTLNPISEQHWIKKIFFDDPISDVYTLKTTFLDNGFIDEDYKLVMDNKKKSNPRYYNIYALGNWGTAEGLIFQNVEQRVIKESEINTLDCVQGLDFGYTNDPTAFNESYIDTKNKKLYIYDGFYEKGLSNNAISDKIKKLLLHKHQTVADSSEPKSIDAIKNKGVRIKGANKGKDSINSGIDFLLDYEIILNAHLVEFMTEFNNYSWAIDKKTNKTTNKPVDDFNHFIDSLRYATEKYHSKGSRKRLNIDS